MVDHQKASSSSPHNSKSDSDADIFLSYLPSCNASEKVIIIYDQATDDEDSESFELSCGKKYTTAYMLRRALRQFLYNKLCIDSRHQFALMYLNQHSFTWECDFTSDVPKVLSHIMKSETCKSEDVFNFNPVFETMFDHLEMNKGRSQQDGLSLPPNYIVHVILLYARSYTMPVLEKNEKILEYFNSPYFTIDIVMTHNQPDTTNRCNDIFNELQQFDPKGSGYSFSVSRNAAQLYEAMAKVLSHPLQRPPQSLAKYNIERFKDM